MKNSYGFFTSFETLRLLQNAKRDMLFHTMNPADYTGHEDLQRKAAIDHPYAEHLRAYPMTRFYHPHMEPLCNYAAGYHGYHWSGMHAAQGSALFEAAGIYDAGLGKRLRAYYAKGVSQPYRQAYRDFAGGDASPAALLKEMGYTALAPALPTLALKHS